MFLFFQQTTAYDLRISDWSSDVCSSYLFHQFGLPAARLAPAQVHAQQHLGPVLRLGTTGAGLDVDERVVRIHLAGEHALEFQLADLRLELAQIVDHRLGSLVISVGDRHFQQITGIGERSEEHTSELQSLMRISYAVFCLKKKTNTQCNNI